MDVYSSILVTGSSGMVGKSLVRKLKEKGFENLILPSSSDLNLINQKETESFFKKNKIEYVFHLAGKIGGIGANISQPVEFLYENMMINFNVVNSSYINNIKKLLFLGSSCIYPLNTEQPMKEDCLLSGKLEPTNEGYSLAKISGIKLCEFINRQYNANYLCLIPPNLYGYHDHFNDTNSHVISSLIYKFHNAKTNNLPCVEIWGSGLSRREFMFVDDASDAMIYFMNYINTDKNNSIINIGTGHDISISDLALMIKKIVDYKGKLYFDLNKPDGMPNKLMDSSISDFYGWKSKKDLNEGIEITYQWYKNEYKED